jgi:hypothetical protein
MTRKSSSKKRTKAGVVPATPAAAGIVPGTAVKATPMDIKAEKGDQSEKPKCQLPQKPVNFFGTAMPRPAIAKDGKFDDDFVLPNDPLLRESLNNLKNSLQYWRWQCFTCAPRMRHASVAWQEQNKGSRTTQCSA